MVRRIVQRKILDKIVEFQYSDGLNYGIFLSGGLDSLSLLNWISIEAPSLIKNLSVFTIKKENTKYAENIASYYSLKNHYYTERGDSFIAAKRIIDDYKNISEFFAGVTALPQDKLIFSGPQAVRVDEPTSKVQLPFYQLDKRYSVQLAIELGAPIELSHTCTQFTDRHCGECFMCTERRWAFTQLKYSDKIKYVVN